MFTTEIRPHQFRACVYVLYDRAASAVDMKHSLLTQMCFFKGTSALLVVLEGRLLQLQRLPTVGPGQHRLESVSDT